MKDRLGIWARTATWAFLVCGALLAAGIVIRQPGVRTSVAAVADHLATSAFLVSHVLGSVGDTVVGLVVTAGAAFTTSIIGFALRVFAQPPFLPLVVIAVAVSGVAIARAAGARDKGAVVLADEVTVR